MLGYDRGGERGAVSFIIAIFVFTLILVTAAALASDLSATANRGQELQSASDAAALAGVVAYEEALLADPLNPIAAQGVARTVAETTLTQNGVDHLGNPDIVPIITFPGVGGQVTVRVEDDTVTSILGPIAAGVFPFEHGVARESTAEFLGCPACGIQLPVPKPFNDVDAEGDGDGFIPIEAGDELYAINHNSSSNQIVCVNTELEEPCWTEGDVDGAPFENHRDAYSSPLGANSPEMPHAAVVDGRVWWSASNNLGLRLYCFDIDAKQACTGNGETLSTDPRFNAGSWPLITRDKDENRGGGTVAYRDRIYAFTDNHEIHCYDPIAGDYCSDFNQRLYGGMPTKLDPFPDSAAVDGNHGGSIDRIVDTDSGYIYSTIHIPYAVPNKVTAINCAASVPEIDADDLVGEIVTIESGGLYVTALGIDNVQLTADVNAPGVRWRMTREPASDDVYFESLTVDEWLDGEDDLGLLPSVLRTDNNKVEADNAWILAPTGGGFTIENRGAPTSFINRTPFNTAVQEIGATTTTWNISRCLDEAAELGYASGTWVHCYDTGEISGQVRPCPDFDPGAPMHANGTRFSGRLFFNRDPAAPGAIATKSALCSSGYTNPGSTSGNPTEIKCVDLDTGQPDTSTDFSTLAGRITAVTGNSPNAWGVPHYNAFQNRLIYPTQWRAGVVLCWDFDSPGPLCGEFVGETHVTATNPNEKTGDYGFISKGNCVFALGHLEFFWAFQAGDFGKPCVGATSQVSVTQCQCTGLKVRWGVLDFSELDLTKFDVLRLWVTTDPPDEDVPGVLLWPDIAPGETARETYHELTPRGDDVLINLDDALEGAVIPGNSVRIVFYTEAPGDPFNGATIPQGELRFLIRPRLVD